MIGIDVIDLTYPDNFKKHSFESYSKRILHFSETSICWDTRDLMLVWCIKESIYKCWCNRGGEPFYNPKRIQITKLCASSKTFVGEIGETLFYGHFSLNNTTLVSVATSVLGDLEKIKVFLSTNKHSSSEYTFLFGQSPQVVWSSKQPVNSVKSTGKLYYYSKSHHGNWYASVIVPSA